MKYLLFLITLLIGTSLAVSVSYEFSQSIVVTLSLLTGFLVSACLFVIIGMSLTEAHKKRFEAKKGIALIMQEVTQKDYEEALTLLLHYEELVERQKAITRAFLYALEKKRQKPIQDPSIVGRPYPKNNEQSL